ncbi:MAG: hypothetical protein BMS9Abin37_1956 [Acidobacteriota bacterium]|nr:MAG: hypothetical protein BMS9Abin37_1956 [Acidobacteriota bacterium]
MKTPELHVPGAIRRRPSHRADRLDYLAVLELLTGR